MRCQATLSSQRWNGGGNGSIARGMTEVLTERGASAQTAHDESHPLLAKHPSYKFTFVNHVTTNTFFTPTKYGIADAAAFSAYLRRCGRLD